MTVRVSKQPINLREKLSELERPIGVKGSELMRSETAQEARDLVSAGRKNIIINGAMEIAQRSTSVTGSTAAGAYLSVDRFANHASGGTYNSSQEVVTVGGMSGLPIKFKNYFRFDVTTGANNCGIWQSIEDVRTVQGEHTFSFYARGINPGGGKLELDSRQDFNDSAAVDTIITSELVLTDVWQRFTFTFTPPSLSGKTIGSSNYYRPFIRQPNSDNSTNAWRIDITGVQLEVGKNATEFEHRSYGEELALCQRYFFMLGDQLNGALPHASYYSSVLVAMSVEFPVTMRANPTLYQVSGTNYFGIYANSIFDAFSSFAIARQTNTCATLDANNTGASGTQGHSGPCKINDSAARLGFQSEL